MRTSLVIVGAILEFVGIVLIGWPDLLPGARRVSGWLSSRYSSFRGWLRRVLRRPRHHTISASSGLAIALGGGARGVVSPSADSTDSELIQYLLGRVALMEEAVDDVRVLIAGNEKRREQAEVALRSELTADFQAGLDAAFAQHRPLRVAGMVALFVGLVCVTLASTVYA
jgi:hypothetical protein